MTRESEQAAINAAARAYRSVRHLRLGHARSHWECRVEPCWMTPINDDELRAFVRALSDREVLALSDVGSSRLAVLRAWASLEIAVANWVGEAEYVT